MTELKPCPCRHARTPKIKAYERLGGTCWVARIVCWWGNCYEGPIREAETKEGAIRLAAEAWNTRPQPEAEELLEWAENNPEPVIRIINSWWKMAGKGLREEWFNFRGAIEDAREESDE